MGRAKSAEPRYYTFVPVASGVGSPPAQQRNCCRSGSQRVGAQRVCSILLVLLLAVLVCLYKADLLLALHNPSKASGRVRSWRQRAHMRVFQTTRQQGQEGEAGGPLAASASPALWPQHSQAPPHTSDMQSLSTMRAAHADASPMSDQHMPAEPADMPHEPSSREGKTTTADAMVAAEPHQPVKQPAASNSPAAGAAQRNPTAPNEQHHQQSTQQVTLQQRQPHRRSASRTGLAGGSTSPVASSAAYSGPSQDDVQATEPTGVAADPLQQGAEGQITDSLLEAAESEAVAPAPPVPPAPSNVRDWQLAWPPGVTPEGVAEATRRLEALTQRTLHLDDPEQPWNQQPSRFELQSVDGHVRHNPSFKATANNQTMFVKFPCIRGHHDLDNTLMCERGQLQNATAASKRHTESIQRVSDYCGFGHIRTRSWTAPVHGTTPQGIEVNGQLGMFAEWARGTNPESMGKEAKRVWANSVPIEWVWYAAVHDFIMCESDRHQGNLVIPDDHPEQPFVFIDNDHELSNRRSLAADLLTPRDPSCIPSSLFFPMNLESWRVHHYHLPLMKLDYRCSTAPGQDIPLPSRIRACLQVFAATSAAELQRNFDIVLLEFAEGLRQRAQDLLELGFWGALEKTASQGEAGFWADPSRLPFEDTMFPHWRGSIWRPLEAPFCDWLEPIPAGR